MLVEGVDRAGMFVAKRLIISRLVRHWKNPVG
jgi:hypothetical protein